ncbi:MAG: acyl carrier protein [Deltaproteobacteria bacterium]|nr:MAG: acyl carrier protein [Deltaproteobacteria bacterium]
MDRNEIENRVRRVIGSVLNIDPNQLRLDASLKDDLGATSLDRYTILMDIEDTFGLELDDVPEEQLERNIRTVSDVVEFIEFRMKGNER